MVMDAVPGRLLVLPLRMEGDEMKLLIAIACACGCVLLVGLAAIAVMLIYATGEIIRENEYMTRADKFHGKKKP